MSKTVLIWNLVCVFACTITLLIALNKNRWKSLMFKILVVILILTLGTISILAIKINDEKLKGNLQIIFEVICWGIILFSLIKNGLMKTKVEKIINKKEVIIFTIMMAIGLIYTGILAITNYKYISPSNETGIIGNYYFNADVYRGIVDASELETQHMIHPTYRFMLMPFVFPIILFGQIAPKLNINFYAVHITSGYFISIVQILLNSISTVIFYKILKKENIENKIAMGRCNPFCSIIFYDMVIDTSRNISNNIMLAFNIYIFI